jgi:hypothetical protein
MSPQQCREKAAECDRIADCFDPKDHTHVAMKEAAAQWRRLAESMTWASTRFQLSPASSIEPRPPRLRPPSTG